MVTLGLTPIDVTVNLSPDTSFVTALVAPEPWPAGTSIELRFTNADGAPTTVWPATITGARADWSRPDTACAAVLAAQQNRVRLVCTDPDGHELLWAKGRVRAV